MTSLQFDVTDEPAGEVDVAEFGYDPMLLAKNGLMEKNERNEKQTN